MRVCLHTIQTNSFPFSNMITADPTVSSSFPQPKQRAHKLTDLINFKLRLSHGLFHIAKPRETAPRCKSKAHRHAIRRTPWSPDTRLLALLDAVTEIVGCHHFEVFAVDAAG